MSAKSRNITDSYNPIQEFKKLVPHHTITPYDIPNILNATTCHEKGITGKGITVGIIDSGCYEHSYFQTKRIAYRQMKSKEIMKFVDGWKRPTIIHEVQDYLKKTFEEDKTNLRAIDAVERSEKIKKGKIDLSISKLSHGTAMVANIYATAPSITLIVYSTSNMNVFIQLEKAFRECDIISISTHLDAERWDDMTKEKYKQLFLKTKKIIIYCMGNIGRIPWPVQNCRENMIIVGGVYKHSNNKLQASDYATAKMDNLPDICGLCGMVGKERKDSNDFPNKDYPSGAYIWLPADPANHLDISGQENIPKGWNLASGTSSATPQVAGVVALMLQQSREEMNDHRDLTTKEIRAILRKTATEVTEGVSYDGVKASEGQKKWCLLVNAKAAIEKTESYAKNLQSKLDELLKML